MPRRWSTEQVLALAPDDSSRRAGAALAKPASWTSWGAAGDLVWGLCAGSGKSPYQTVVDLTGPAYKCSCPSRKFPCKHALGLLLAWAGSAVPVASEPSGYARAWQEGRVASARTRTQKLVAEAAGDKVKDEAAAARRAEQRARRVSAGVAELQLWLRDQVRAGLSGAQAGGYRHAEPIAARMVDAQAPGLAGALRRLSAIPASGDGWPGRLLGEYAQLHLLARAYDQIDALPPGLAAVVRSRVGYTTSREEVLATPAVSDRWQVLGTRDVIDAPVPARRVWLRGRDTRRCALLLSFAAGPAGSFPVTTEAALTAGDEIRADMHFYPGQPPLRAATGENRSAPADCGRPEPPAGGIATLLQEWAAALEQDPWLAEWPALVAGTPVAPAEPARPAPAGPGAATFRAATTAAGDRWYLVDETGAAVPLRGQDSLWQLLAVSGGNPVTVAGEWSASGLTPLTVWYGDQAVRL
jgi:SWIM zinc finger